MAFFKAPEADGTKPADPAVPQTTEAVHTPVIEQPKIAVKVEGEPWVTVAYYNQILSADSEAAPLDPLKPPSLQQYRKVVNYKLSVTSRPSYQMNDLREDAMTGEANFLPNTIVPHIGDMFIAYLGNQRLIWTVTGENIRSLSMYMQRVYQGDFRFFSSDPALEAQLEEKTSNQLYFDDDLLEKGEMPILDQTQKTERLDYAKLFKQTISVLYRNHFDRALGTFITINDNQKCYDAFAVDFFNRAVPRSRLSPQRHPSRFATEILTTRQRYPTIWQALIDKVDVEDLLDYPRYFPAQETNERRTIHNRWTLSRSGVDQLYMSPTWERDVDDSDLTPYMGSEALWSVSEESYTEDDKLIVKALKGAQWTSEELETVYDRFRTDKTENGLRWLVLLSALLATYLERQGNIAV